MSKQGRLRAKGTGSVFRNLDRSPYWQIAYMSGGKRRYESSGSERKEDAQKLLTSKLGDVQKGIVVTPQTGKITLGKGLAAVVEDQKQNGRKSAVCRECKAVCHDPEHKNDMQRRIEMHLLPYFGEHTRMSVITTARVNSYKAHRLAQKAKHATVNRELAALRRAFRLALRGGELLTIPYIGLLHEDNVGKGFFEHDQLETLLPHLPAELQPVVQFAYITGWRKSEVLSLTVAQVDLKVGVVQMYVGTSKDRKGRTFYMTTELRKVLQKQLDSVKALQEQGKVVPYVFHWSDGSRIKDFRKTWANACEAAGFPGKKFHDFRRTAVRNLERAGAPRSTAMAMVGHKTESIYRRYAIVDEAMHREAAEKLDVWASQQEGKATGTSGKVRQFRRR
jgi:integrase